MRIAFYAPLKPPDHPVPSGDRQMARLLMRALRVAGHEVFLASRLRSRDGAGDAAAQARIRSQARQEATLLSARFVDDPPDCWFTYHLYYKAPDLIGPELCRSHGIPYIAAEASHAAKRLEGPHAGFARDALTALDQAAAVIAMTGRDYLGLKEIVAEPRLCRLRPFTAFQPRPSQVRGAGPVRLLAVGMMRPGDKLHSYRLLAGALKCSAARNWRLTIVGHGPASREVRRLFAPVSGKVRFLGAIPSSQLHRLYGEHDLMVWPAVNEAYGMAPLEASAHGLPVLLGDEGGVREIVREGENGLLVPPRDPAAFAAALDRLIREPARLRRLKARSWRHVGRAHRLSQAAKALDRIVRAAC